jgi:hypothetical protein
MLYTALAQPTKTWELENMLAAEEGGLKRLEGGGVCTIGKG